MEWEYANASNWDFLGWLYDDVLYATSQDFQAAYQSGKIKTSVPNVDGEWAHSGHHVSALQ